MIYFIGNKPLFEDSNISYISPSEALARLEGHDLLAVDTETSGLNFRQDKIISLQIGTVEDQYFIDTRTVDINLFKDILEKTDLILQNSKFDYKFLKYNGILIENIWDTMIAECVLHCGKEKYGYGLADLAKRYLDIELNKELQVSFIGITDQPFTKDQIIYGSKDVELLFKIRDKQLVAAGVWDLLDCIKLEMEAILPLADIEMNGMKLDVKGWLEYEANCKREYIEIEKKLDKITLENTEEKYYTQGDLFEEPLRLTSINWRSPKQVLEIAEGCFGLNLVNKDGKASSGVDALKKFKDSPFVELLLKHRELAKKISTYGKKFIENYIHSDGRIRTSFWQILNYLGDLRVIVN